MEHDDEKGMKYRRFLLMIATSTAVMFGLMYLNTYALDHVRWSQTRFWMAFVMGAAMAIVMLAFMLGMYRDRKKNLLIFGVSAAVFAGALGLVRSQATVGDVAWMKAMIPHHSIAILTSERRTSATRACASSRARSSRRSAARSPRWSA